MKIKSKIVIIVIITTVLVITTSFTTKTIVNAFAPNFPIVIAQNQGNMTSHDRQEIPVVILQNNQPISQQAQVKVDRIAIVDDYAVAIVLVGEHGGGMSVLKKAQSGWQVIGGGGGAFDDKYLIQIGIPPETAHELMQQIK